MSEEFNVNIGLRHGSALSPLMFIMVMEQVSMQVSLSCSMGRTLYMDDLAVMVESGWEIQEGTGGVEGGIWEAWAEDEYGED